MTDCIPPTENQALGRRQSLHNTFSLALALARSVSVALAVHGAPITRAPAKLVRWLSVDLRPPPDQIPENPPRPVPALLDSAQVAAATAALLDPAQAAAATAALESAIRRERTPIESLTTRRVQSYDSDSSDGGGDHDVSGHSYNRHYGYPLIRSLGVGDARLFFGSGTAGSAPELHDARQGDGVRRWVPSSCSISFRCTVHIYSIRDVQYHSILSVACLI
jgi:hypothetical protein